MKRFLLLASHDHEWKSEVFDLYNITSLQVAIDLLNLWTQHGCSIVPTEQIMRLLCHVRFLFLDNKTLQRTALREISELFNSTSIGKPYDFYIVNVDAADDESLLKEMNR